MDTAICKLSQPLLCVYRSWTVGTCDYVYVHWHIVQ